MMGTEIMGCEELGQVRRPRELGTARATIAIGESMFVTGKHMRCGHAVRFLLCGFLLWTSSLGAGQVPGDSPHKPESGDGATSPRNKNDACILLTSAEIEAVQGEPVKETKANVQPNGEMLVSECLFHTTNFAKSVSVALATTASAKSSALTPRKFWQKQFHAPLMEEVKMSAASREAQKPEPENEEARKPRRIKGLGDEAYWVGTPIAGALYVLQGDTFVRISVGGVGEESARIKKSEVLARAVVKRL
jgi:hypothetical protein